ncbi:cysteine--tRNA ligase [Moraxella catarrhalis]|uniref:cysteine--tRNA ligase n=1 Tax=Moraxella catarrhalis TaxID=480 RepID=UPI000EA8FE92|nr:cysteine--tRNA ligase [Moraxella catarrhalis]MPW55713.1 cysteine--tRNA ligase [Moraxella catarrhalis]MPX01277.1 cysteine--tRNA ligase [Moraxella catarrhalis]MPX40897.1 cysteine--tRNA ligase [Moraxella catarrhalis]RKL92891.1 cysteine--tRNA ligase [Moraxella catarrhalis]RKL98974.1 cysteine--tRNA ligase [Moraxella catarrhalis]
MSALRQTQSQLQLYDTLSASKRPFKPIHAGQIGIYVCGMTVYDYCHMGHARVMVGFDVIVRWLRAIGYQVNYVRNITDIDDKIIQRAYDNGETITELTDRFITAMHQDEQFLGCQSPNIEPRATEHIENMQHLIDVLLTKNLAYQGSGGDVYYAIEKFPNYGKLSKRHVDDMQAGASERVSTAEDKRHPFDFVLWKTAKPSEPHWQSPWGLGRPGWHIECSAMSTCCLGETFDIHGGGHDLQFPHHENEIAQSEGATGKTYANHWMHMGFINIDGEKMSKSLGNFFTIREVVDKFHPETIRFFLLSSHYRSPVNFSDTALKESHTALSRIYQSLKSAENFGIISIMPNAWESEAGQAFAKAMNDDFNTPKAVSVLFSVVTEINRAMKAGEYQKATQEASTLKTLASVLNIAQSSPHEFLQANIGNKPDGLSDAEIANKIAQRQQAKAQKNFAKADAIRDELNRQGIELEDGRMGTTWRRI